MKNKHLEVTLNYFNIPVKLIDIDKVINVYVYGSHNYGTNNMFSDLDYIIVYEQDIDESDTLTTKIGNTSLDATLISPNHFQEMLDMHDIRAMECLFIEDDWKYETQKFNFNLDLVKLRHSISAASSNYWIKTKKKLLQGDDKIAYKSLFHSLRILDFGIQLAKYKQISDFKISQSETLCSLSFERLLEDISELKNWDNINKEFKKTYNKLRSEFKKLAPKNNDNL